MTGAPRVTLGPTVMRVKGKYVGPQDDVVEWILKGSDLDMAFTFACAARSNMSMIGDAAAVDKGAANDAWFSIDECSDVPTADSVHSRIRAFQWTCVICGLFLVIFVLCAFELKLRDHADAQREVTKRPRRRSFVDKADSGTLTDPTLDIADVTYDDEEANDRHFLGLDPHDEAKDPSRVKVLLARRSPKGRIGSGDK